MRLMSSLMASSLLATSRQLGRSVVGRAPRSFLTVLPSRPATTTTTSCKRTGRIFAVATLLASTAAAAAGSNGDLPVYCAADNIFPEESLTMDTYNGVILKIDYETTAADGDFEQKLKAALEQWRTEGKRGIWIHIPTRFSHLVPICTSLGFDFHTCKPGMLVLTQWLPTDMESRLPHGPTHQVGIGALVLNPEGKMLVVQEKTGPAAAMKLWKMPTGLLDPGEDLRSAAVRELKEETGLDGDLLKITCFRQAHAGGDRGSDLFFICLMKLKDPEQQASAQEEEIAAIQWMDMEEFSAQEVWQESPVYKALNEAMMEAVKTRGAGMQDETLSVGFRPGMNTIYVPAKL